MRRRCSTEWASLALFSGVLSAACSTTVAPALAPTHADHGHDAALGSEAGADRFDAQTKDAAEPSLSAQALELLRDMAPNPLPTPPTDISNSFADDPKAAAFGQRLFFDARFSGELLDGDNDGTSFALGTKGEVQKVACAGCHVPDGGFSDVRSIRRQVSLGAGWGLRRAPSLFDVAQSKLLNWDGHRDSLQSQVFGPIQSANEMNSSRLFATRQVYLHHRTEYEALFGPLPGFDDSKRFPSLSAREQGCRKLDPNLKCVGATRGEPGDAAEFDGMQPADQDAVTQVWFNVGKAVGAYERLLTCGPGRFDRWMQGDDSALNQQEKRGAALFVGKAGCVACHSGPFFSDEQFHNVGLKPTTVATVFINANDRGAAAGLPLVLESPLNVRGPYSDGDDGRLPTSVEPRHEGAFRTPRLRCVAQRPSFMHTAQLVTLEEVVNFFARGGDQYGYPGTSEIRALELSPEEVGQLVMFLKALTGPGPSAELLRAP